MRHVLLPPTWGVVFRIGPEMNPEAVRVDSAGLMDQCRKWWEYMAKGLQPPHTYALLEKQGGTWLLTDIYPAGAQVEVCALVVNGFRLDLAGMASAAELAVLNKMTDKTKLPL